MQLHVSPSDGVPIYQQVVNQIKYLVASGRLKQGEQLLPVRKLAEQLIVNPNTVARAYRELEAEGVVESRRGSGVFVSEGVSPLAKREQNRILNERIDMLLAEAAHMNVEVEAVIKLIHQRSQQMR
ncbi:MAG: GntR family transcriptional regulator [Planctomycetaceae bacterium]|nr:GntR family transcriptional regulator [Planctomycetales bacterium]MCB9926601.1 GntR family transcriptional regulator [Planctomycetaceae bacterium]